MVDETGQVLEQMLFTHIVFPDVIDPQAFEPQASTAGFETIRQTGPASPKAASKQDWTIDDLPPGFRVAAGDAQQLGSVDSPVNHLLLTDGLATVSVFAATNKLPNKVFEGVSSLGAVNAYGRMIGEQHIAVVGEVPARTVELIAPTSLNAWSGARFAGSAPCTRRCCNRLPPESSRLNVSMSRAITAWM